ncbi:DUF2834 domain-containing protein [Methanolobus sp. ZRKC2]|uniref:DUF2834 domain-containing protein n=1 Tax=Methanolobus sp. ZRKC2 TaxID=3125783 RepID=UPI0032449367
MKLRNVYLILCIAGFILPYFYFVSFLMENGIDIQLFVEQMLASDISSFFAMDVIVSAIVLLVFIATEGRRLHMKKLWLPVVATLLVGVSLGLPLFLYMRQLQLDNDRISV